MNATSPQPWARLRLVQGESAARVWELGGSSGQSVMTVGANAGCNWVVKAQGVLPIQFSLHWDGNVLRVADTHGAGGTQLDGQPVTAEWKDVRGRARIEFGAAALVAETSGPGASDSAPPVSTGPLPPPASGLSPSSNPPASASQYPSAQPGQGMLQASAHQSGVAKRPHKATLMGVSPLSAPRPVSDAPPGQSAPPADEFRPHRPGDSDRPEAKRTLLGVNADAAEHPAVSPSQPPGAMLTGGAKRQPDKHPYGGSTMLGLGANPAQVPVKVGPGANPAAQSPTVAVGPQPTGKPVAGASLGSDTHTMQGFPTASDSLPPGPGVHVHVSGRRRDTQQGPLMDGSAPKLEPERVVTTPASLPVGAPASPSQSSRPVGKTTARGPVAREGGMMPVAGAGASPAGAAWQEGPSDAARGEIVSEPAQHAVLVGEGAPPEPAQAKGAYPPVSGTAPTLQSGYPAAPAQPEPREATGDRLSEAPTVMRNMADLPPAKKADFRIPWRYIGLGLLTAVAYVAWLYLLDHL